MIEPIFLTEVSLPAGHPRAGERCPVFGFLIWHPDGPVLVDTGVGREHDEVERALRPRHKPIEDALAHRGIEPGDVAVVINSHLHFDHCGNNRPFAGVPMVVQRTEYDLRPPARLHVVETRGTVTVIPAQALYDPSELEAEKSAEPLSRVEAEAPSDSARAIKSLRPMAVYFSHGPGVWTLGD